MPQVSLNGHAIYYEEHGSGAALVFLHGDFECTRYWSAQLAYFSPSYRVILYDRHGYGRSAPCAALPPDFYERDAADLVALLDHLEIEQAHLVGHSGGGTVALLAAARYPRRIRSVVAAGAHSYVEPLTVAFVEDFAARLETPALRRAGEACHGRRWREVGAMFTTRWLNRDWRDWTILPDLPRIRCPVFLALGTEDGTASLDQFTAMAQAIGDVRTWLVEGGGHVLHRQMPAQFNHRVQEFLNSLAHHV